MNTWRRRAFLLMLKRLLENPLLVIISFAFQVCAVVVQAWLMQRMAITHSAVQAGRDLLEAAEKILKIWT